MVKAKVSLITTDTAENIYSLHLNGSGTKTVSVMQREAQIRTELKPRVVMQVRKHHDGKNTYQESMNSTGIKSRKENECTAQSRTQVKTPTGHTADGYK